MCRGKASFQFNFIYIVIGHFRGKKRLTSTQVTVERKAEDENLSLNLMSETGVAMEVGQVCVFLLSML